MTEFKEIIMDEIPQNEKLDEEAVYVIAKHLETRFEEDYQDDRIKELESEVHDLKTQRDKLEHEIERLKLENRRAAWIITDGERYIESIDERDNVIWTDNPFEAITKETITEAVMLAKRAGVTVTLKQIGVV